MKIKKLTVRNFKNIAEAEFELSKFNLFYGENGSGKSGILSALRYLLNGDLPKDAIKDGENELCVSALLDDENGTTISRFAYLPEERMINGKSVKDAAFFQRVQEARLEFQAMPYDLRLLSHSHHFFEGKEASTLFSFLEAGTVDGARLSGVKELEVELNDGTVLYRRASKQNRVEINGRKCTIAAFNKMLESYGIRDPRAIDIVTSSDMMDRIGMADFGKYLLQNLPVKIDFDRLAELAELDDEEKETLRPLLPPVPGVITVDCIEKAYSHVYDTRAIVNANVKAELQKSIFEDELPTKTKDEAMKEIAEINQKLGAYRALQRAHANYEATIAARKKTLEQLAALQTKLADPRFAGIQQPDYNHRASLQKLQKSLYDSRQAAYKNFYALKETVRLHKEAIAALDGSQCPVYKGLTCRTDRSSYRSELVRLTNEASQGVLDAQKAYKEIGVSLTDTERQLGELESQIRIWEEKCGLERQIQAMNTSMPAEPEKPQELPDVQELNQTLAVLNAMIPVINAYEETGKAKERYKKAIAQYELYDRLVRKTNPKNGLLMSVIMQQVITPLESHCNAVANTIYPDCYVKFTVDEKGLGVLFHPHDKSCLLSPDALSTGEKMQLTFILMDLVSTISGCRIMVFDNIEALDKNSLTHLLNLVEMKELKERYDHILFAVVDHDSIMDEIGAISCIQKISMAK